MLSTADKEDVIYSHINICLNLLIECEYCQEIIQRQAYNNHKKNLCFDITTPTYKNQILNLEEIDR